MRPLFAYGTLQDPEVFLMVTDNLLSHHMPQPARLHGYSCFQVEGQDYPAAVADETKNMVGLLIHGLNHRLLDVIQEYETSEYELKDINVEVSGQMLVVAQAFFPTDELKISDSIWTYEDWRIDHKMPYLEQLRHFLNTGEWSALQTQGEKAQETKKTK